MEIEITEQTLKDLDYIKNHIVEKFRDEIVDISALVVILEAIVQKQEEFEKEMGE